MLEKEPAQMSRSDAQASRKNLHSPVFQSAFAYQSQCTGDGVGGSQPCRSSWRTFRAASQAGTEPSFSGSGCAGKVAYVLLLTGWRRTYGTAVNAAIQRTDKEFAIEAWVAR